MVDVFNEMQREAVASRNAVARLREALDLPFFPVALMPLATALDTINRAHMLLVAATERATALEAYAAALKAQTQIDYCAYLGGE